MALKKVDKNEYIKISLDGTFKIYKAAKERTQEKKAPTFEEIRDKYQEVLTNMRNDHERLYYDPTFRPLLDQWEMEYEKYLQMHLQGKRCKDFPLMTKYIPNIKDSLPELLCEGQLGVSGNTLAEVYESVKHYGYFGEVEDC
jgi:hypothetical protein